ncbi:hypothetical protein BO94DRAFT_617641 [Aspergillus sclerotioniger CBS 115572]|uniref:Uncharacterized protein n=1 Tax=Aspergillus sclerotioniger CBS 115572 TaxID=1450535 RepID=A0A317WZW5_9EURO|nr:hypothetical protein BO94DRAFT_617641 [Aspergillus sclerotioniger CBS 115572]PWY91936.1 hypothetical protein BO94DRAFT_617641 [Aspergillus sclerotioniger CBS 115572]
MDGFDHFNAPLEYQEMKWLVNIFIIGMDVGWLVHYLYMAYTSFKDQTYCMTIAGLCANFAWELVYCILYPAKGLVERAVILSGLFLDFGVFYTAMRNAPNEWHHSAIVRDNMVLVFTAMTLFFLSMHLTLVAQFGSAQAYTWGAAVCQLIISIGDVFQLLSRGNTRGTSWTLWISRFFGSASAVGFALIRYYRWPAAFSWLNCPLILWTATMFLLFEILYGALFFLVKRREEDFQQHKKQKQR